MLDTLDKMDKALDIDRTVENYKELLTECYKDLPPVITKEKIGKWIGDKCSKCGNERAWYGDNPLFCPDCGARMVCENEEGRSERNKADI